MLATSPFVAPVPPRDPNWRPAWRAMFGERVRSIVAGLPEPAFQVWIASGRLLNIRFHIVNHPEMIRRVLLDHSANYVRPELTRKLLAPSLGNGLLTAEGEDWRMQRKLVAPTFAPPAVAELAPLMAQEAVRLTALFPASRARADVAAVATETTMAIISRALFSGDARLMSAEASRHITRLVLAAGEPRFLRLMGYEAFDLSPRMARVRASRRWLRGTLGAIVDERGPDGGADDFFGGLMRSFYASMPPAEARELAIANAITFYAAGHETTAVALAWSAYLLAAQPELQEQVRAEALAAVTGDPANLSERVPLLRQFLDETLRLYPPAAQIVRQALADDRLGNVAVKAGDHVIVYPWTVQRHRRLWDNPDAFDIDRFAEAEKGKIDRFQYLPFGAGPRICVGMRFALVEAQIILAHWLAARRFRLIEGAPPPFPTGRVTLRPKGGMPLLVEPLAS
jgi:cytochrome P450